MCRFYTKYYTFCGHRVEYHITPCEDYSFGCHRKYCSNSVKNSSSQDTDEVCPDCESRGLNPAEGTVPARRDGSTRLIKRCDAEYKYEKPHSIDFVPVMKDTPVFQPKSRYQRLQEATDEEMLRRREERFGFRTAADKAAEGPTAKPTERPKAGSSGVEATGKREGSPGSDDTSWEVVEVISNGRVCSASCHSSNEGHGQGKGAYKGRSFQRLVGSGNVRMVLKLLVKLCVGLAFAVLLML